MCGQSLGERGVVAAGLVPALVRQCQHVRHGGVGQGKGGGPWHRAGHIGHAVEHAVVDGVGRFVMSGGA
ncbi:Uncharacterised protein [Mycobacteroides abscessus subsp. massiliense]|nr:Uncharacterised protein [Mycobacteroides abscessus subsp. massiliense]